MMNINRLSAVFCFVVLGSPALAQENASPSKTPGHTTTDQHSATSQAGPTAPDAAELTQLLKDFLAGASRNDVAIHDRFWAEELIYTSSAGRRFGKAELMRDVREEAAPKQTDKSKAAADQSTIFTAEDIRIQQYGTTAIVAFRLVGTTAKGDKPEVTNYLNSGTFLKRDGKWQVVNWQATKLPPAEPAQDE